MYVETPSVLAHHLTLRLLFHLSLALLLWLTDTVRNTNNFKGNLRQWNTSSVENMSKMFLNCDAFTGNGIDAWDTSRVVDMKDMFRYTPTFNGDVSFWNVSRVSTMRGMFRQAVAFNSDLSQWDMRSVTDISQMVSAKKSVTEVL